MRFCSKQFLKICTKQSSKTVQNSRRIQRRLFLLPFNVTFQKPLPPSQSLGINSLFPFRVFVRPIPSTFFLCTTSNRPAPRCFSCLFCQSRQGKLLYSCRSYVFFTLRTPTIDTVQLRVQSFNETEG